MKPEIIFEWNIRTFKDFTTALRVIYDKFKEQINPELYYQLVLTRTQKKRTISQNSLYWLFNTFIANNHSQFANENECHYIFRAMFLKKAENEIPIELLTASAMQIFTNANVCMYSPQLPLVIDIFSRKTSQLKTKMFSDYLNEIAQFAADNLDLRLVFPDEPDWQDFYNEYKNKR